MSDDLSLFYPHHVLIRRSNWIRESIHWAMGTLGPTQFHNESPVDQMKMANDNWQSVNRCILFRVSERLR